MNEGDLAVEKKDDAGALKAYAAAEALVPDSAEMVYWHAVALVEHGAGGRVASDLREGLSPPSRSGGT